MYRKLFAFILLSSSTAAAAYAQTPVPPAAPETRAFSMFFDSDGGYLGIQTVDVTKENFAKYGLRYVRGAAVEKVVEGSPAAAAGLQNGDVVVEFNGEAITSVRKLTRLIGEVAPDHQARIKVLRGGSEREFTVTVGKRPAPKFEDGNFRIRVPQGTFDFPDMPGVPPIGSAPRVPNAPDAPGDVFVWRGFGNRQIGISVSPMTKQLGEHFGVTDGKGLLINNVRENSPAFKAGLKAGDVIVEVDGKAVSGDLDLIRAVNDKKEGNVTLTIVRDRNRQTISVTPETVNRDIGPMLDRMDGAPESFRMVRPALPISPAVVAPGVRIMTSPRVL